MSIGFGPEPRHELGRETLSRAVTFDDLRRLGINYLVMVRANRPQVVSASSLLGIAPSSPEGAIPVNGQAGIGV